MSSSSCASSSRKTHKAKSAREWKQRLHRFAAGEKFRRGEAPAKGSQWDKTVQRILACPTHQDGKRDCVCQYHRPVSCNGPADIAT